MNNYVTTHGNKMAPIAQSDHSPTTSTNSTSSMSSITTLDEKQQHQSSQAKQQQHPKEPTRNHSALSSSAISRQITNSTTSMSNAEFSTTSKRKCFISVWSTWYAFLVFLLHLYLINLHFVEILKLIEIRNKSFKISHPNQLHLSYFDQKLNELNEHIYFELVSRVSLLSLSIVFLFVFILTSLKPLGNYSNDGVKFGRDFFSEKLIHSHVNEISISHTSLVTEKVLKNKKKCCWFSVTSLLETLWRHFLPASHFSHLIAILLLFLSRIIFSDSISNSYGEISGCFAAKNSTTLPNCVLECFIRRANLTQRATDATTAFQNIGFLLKQCELFKFEILSYALACSSLYIRYGSVFWFTNKSLSFLVTFIGLLAAVEQLLQVYSFIYIFQLLNDEELYQLIINLDYRLSVIQSKTASVSVITTQIPISPYGSTGPSNVLIRNKITLLFLYFFLSAFVYLSATPAYVFSFLKYKERFMIEESLFSRAFKANKLSIVSKDKDQKPHDRRQMAPSACCFNYCPHLIATIQLVLICVCKMPFCYDYIVHYNAFKDFGVMLVIIVEILHIIVLIFIWLLLTLKTDWTMHLQTAFSICHWTYHLRFKSDSPNKMHKDRNEIKQKVYMEQKLWLGPEDDNLDNFEKSLTAYTNDKQRPIVHSQSEYQDVSSHHLRKTNVKRLSALSQKQADSKNETCKNCNENTNCSQHPLRRSVVTIRSNTNKSKQFKQQLGNQARGFQDAKHKSLYLEGAQYSPESKLKATNSDYFLNSETLYRDDLRKSSRNIVPHKQLGMAKVVRPASICHNGITLPIFNQTNNNFNPLLEYENPKNLIEPIFYTSSEQKVKFSGTRTKNYISGVYLTATPPQIFDSTSTSSPMVLSQKGNYQKLPTLTALMPSTTKPIDTSNNVANEMNNSTHRSMIFLERPANSGNEYESRV